MSFSLYIEPESFLRTKAVIGPHDYQNSSEYSSKEVAAKENKIELRRLVSEESHPSLVPGGCGTECQSESRELNPVVEGLQFPVWSCGIEPLRTSHLNKQPWKVSYTTSESSKAGLEETDSDSGGSDSSTEELEIKFGSQLDISSDTFVQRVQEGESEKWKKIKGVKTESPVIDDPSVEQVIAVPSSLVAVPPFSADNSTVNPLPKDSGKPLPLSQSCTAGSTKLRSALRGGHEELGLGPRPRFHVTWASNVYEPACTSVSHTVSSNHRRHHAKKDHKHRHKGKSSYSESRKKSVNKVSPKSRHSGEAFVLRTQAVTSQKGKCSLREVGLTEPLVLPCNEHTLKSIRLSATMLPQNFSVNGMLPIGERRLVNLDAKLPFSWHVQSHRLVI